MYRINTIEPIWWALFGAGGFVVALLLPIHILIQGIMLPLGAVPQAAYSAARLDNLLGNPIVKLYLLVLISLPLFHWAHRFRYFLFDLGVHEARMPIAVLCYGAAIVGTIITIVVLLRI
jgi:fumarate reductase subunit D